MNYIGTAVTDIGISKKTNQDSVCVKIAESEKHGQVAMVVLCDGMGGLAKGELASATVIRAFSKWFDDLIRCERRQQTAPPHPRRIQACQKSSHRRGSARG